MQLPKSFKALLTLLDDYEAFCSSPTSASAASIERASQGIPCAITFMTSSIDTCGGADKRVSPSVPLVGLGPQASVPSSGGTLLGPSPTATSHQSSVPPSSAVPIPAQFKTGLLPMLPPQTLEPQRRRKRGRPPSRMPHVPGFIPHSG